MIALAIAGHHSGLPNGDHKYQDRLDGAEDLSPLCALPTLEVPKPLKGRLNDRFAASFFIRMLFSTLVDADRSVAGSFGAKSDAGPSPISAQEKLAMLKQALDAYLAEKFPPPDSANPIATLRSEVLADCRTAASLDTGLFSLSVPTGGGKTLSSLAFALDHAIAHDLDRIIYVIPFTSIIDQTAAVFRDALGDADAILEHHSAFDDEALEAQLAKEGHYDPKDATAKLKLAMQNWDRPIIVTTAVQFFESLFAASPKQCRKLHNITRAAIILDEAQTLPVPLLRPCLAALKELTRVYGSSIVLCTATQPALTDAAFKQANPATQPPPEALAAPLVREIVPPGRDLDNRLKRVRCTFAGTMTDDEVVAALSGVDQGLVIVNNRRHARHLYAKMKTAGNAAGACHLTNAMTAAHRQKQLAHIRERLKQNLPVKTISTSLIEAGVDISFSAVWRAIAGLDQIVQAAGRCNRDGKLGPLGGHLTIFIPEEVKGHGMPPELVLNADAAQTVLRKTSDPLSVAAVQDYFAELLWRRSDSGWSALDSSKVGESERIGIMNVIAGCGKLDFPFADIAAAFRVIKEKTVPIIIPASVSADAGIDDKELERPSYGTGPGAIARAAQRHIVQIPMKDRQALIKAGSAYALKPDVYGEQFVILSNANLYSAETGLDWDDPASRAVLLM